MRRRTNFPGQPCLAARNLIAWRQRRGLTQTEAARLFQTDQARYSQIELAKRRPGLQLATRMQIRTGGAVKVFDWHGPEEQQAWRARREASQAAA